MVNSIAILLRGQFTLIWFFEVLYDDKLNDRMMVWFNNWDSFWYIKIGMGQASLTFTSADAIEFFLSIIMNESSIVIKLVDISLSSNHLLTLIYRCFLYDKNC